MSSPRKQSRGRRHLPDLPQSKGVSFSDNVVETSIGGTQTVIKMKGHPLVQVSDDANKDKRTGDKQVAAAAVADSSKPSLAKHAKAASAASASEVENKENVEKTEEKTAVVGKSSQPKPGPESETDVFASPIGRPLKAAQLIKEFEKFTPSKVGNPDSSHRRTTQDCLDDVSSEMFRTPPQHSFKRRTLESEMYATPDCYRVVHMATPQKMYLLDSETVAETDESSVTEAQDGEDSCSITVAVRVRPYSQRELADANVKRVVSMNNNETTVTAENGTVHRFAFDFSFWSFNHDNGDFADQGQVYSGLAQPLLGKAFEGYNTCLFAYGQTGSGKSYSIMGHGEDTGIIPRFCEELFSRAARVSSKDKVKISVEISFFEIYNEKIHDLLASSKEKNGKKATLKVREHPVLGPYVEGLSTFIVNSFEDVEGWITLGTKNRATAATGMNDKSSRSHSVFTIVLTQTKTERVDNQDHDHSITSKINLVDLAGSERQSLAQTTGMRLREGANINKSLMTLGKVISVLSERSVAIKKQRKLFIPYRESVLTWLLKESLGGNSKTAMIATISPSNHHVEETLSTLRYARQTRSIVNVVRVNEDPKAKLIRELRAEIDKLRRQSGGVFVESDADAVAEISMLKHQLLSKEREMDQLTKSWQERLRQAETRKKEESKQLEKSGVAAAVKVDNRLPNLVNLNEDPQLSELLLYVIKEGQTRVGRKTQDSSHDIQLSGALIAPNHCIINNVEGIVNITPIGDAPTYVNGNLITEPTILHHADRVILGGDHFFRFNHPIEVKKSKKTGSGVSSGEVKDFEFARQELWRVQEAKLQEELAEAQKVAEAKMEEELERARRQAEQELHQQKHGYENKLASLEQTLKEQSLEVKKAVESKQEAHSLIQDLRKQKMMLEQEVLAGRRRQQMEAEAAQKVNTEIQSKKSRILELLEAEKVKAAAKLEELRQRRAEIITPSKARGVGGGNSNNASGVGIRKDLYKVALLLREANKISQDLKKDLVFSREDVEAAGRDGDGKSGDGGDGDEGGAAPTTNSQILIRVTHTRHRIFTHWTLAKLQDKVVQMRDIYQNDGDSSADDDEVFNDPEDNWQKEIPSPVASPLGVVGGYQQSPLSVSGLCQRDTSHLNTPSSASPSLRRRVSFGLCSSVGDGDVSWFKACRKMVTSALDHFAGGSMEESIADGVLWDCHALHSCVTSIMNAADSGSPATALQLVLCVQRLSDHCSLWAATFDPDLPLVHDLLSQVTEHVRTVSLQASHVLQGFETGVGGVVQEWGLRLQEEVVKLCQVSGQLCLASKTRMTRLDNFSQQPASSQLGPEVCQAFLSGCNQLLDKTLQGGIKTVEKCQAINDNMASPTLNKELSSVRESVGHTVVSTKTLLLACHDVQVELEVNVVEGRRERGESSFSPPSSSSPTSSSSTVTTVMASKGDRTSYLLEHQWYQRLQQLMTHVSSLADMAQLLVHSTQPLLEGDSQDLRRISRCAELMHRRVEQLLSCSFSSQSLTSVSSISSSNNSLLDTTLTTSSDHHHQHQHQQQQQQQDKQPKQKQEQENHHHQEQHNVPDQHNTSGVSSSILSSSLSSQRRSLDSVVSVSSSILSDSQMEHVDFAAQEVMNSCRRLMEKAQASSRPDEKKQGEVEGGGVSTPTLTPIPTPRGVKRLLPASPGGLGLGRSPMMHLQKQQTQASVLRNLSALQESGSDSTTTTPTTTATAAAITTPTTTATAAATTTTTTATAAATTTTQDK